MRTTPGRIPSSSFPVAATATALDYSMLLDEEPETDTEAVAAEAPLAPELEQGVLFRNPNVDSRVIPFDLLTTRAARQSIRARAAGLERPAPVKTEKIEVRPVRKPKARASQKNFEFNGLEEHAQPKSSIICDAVVAPAALRAQAMLVDTFVMVIPMVIGVAVFFYAGGEFTVDKHTLPFYLLGLATIPLLYKLLWTLAGADSIGMRSAGLVLVDFDGNRPSRVRRFLRCFGSCLSFLAAGIGMVWSLVDEDRLTWHDHISSTFPTVVEH